MVGVPGLRCATLCLARPLRLPPLLPAVGKAKKTRKFAEVKRMMNPKDLKP